MQYLFILLFMAAVFGLCRGIDALAKKRKAGREPGKAVRQPRRTAIFGVLLTFFGFAVELSYFSRLQWYLHAGCAVVFLMGVFLLALWFCSCIRYDEEGFTCRALGRKAASYRYEQIRGQRSFLTRAGVNTVLVMEKGEVQLYSALQGADDFLRFAFYRWCDKTGTDPDTVENNPQYMTYFPSL